LAGYQWYWSATYGWLLGVPPSTTPPPTEPPTEGGGEGEVEPTPQK